MSEKEFAAAVVTIKRLRDSLKACVALRAMMLRRYPGGVAEVCTDEQRATLEALDKEIESLLEEARG